MTLQEARQIAEQNLSQFAHVITLQLREQIANLLLAVYAKGREDGKPKDVLQFPTEKTE